MYGGAWQGRWAGSWQGSQQAGQPGGAISGSTSLLAQALATLSGGARLEGSTVVTVTVSGQVLVQLPPADRFRYTQTLSRRTQPGDPRLQRMGLRRR